MECRYLACLVFFCVTAALAEDAGAGADEWKEVQLEQGKVRGHKHPSGVYAFYNIPYATAPTGENKFKAPLPAPELQEPYFDATDEKVVCPQAVLPNPDIFLLPNDAKQKEDCLIVNVFTPDTNEKNLTVLVYVHGGAFVVGYGNMYQATQIMENKDLITVTFNYRLGIHGFLCLGTEDAPGNAGMKDQVALLQWVQNNIASFGGNPHDVALAGFSAGSVSVDLLMLSKSAKGLFHKVIPESGANLAALAIQRDPLEIAKNHANDLNFTNVDNIDELEKIYKTLPMETLTADSFFYRPDSIIKFSPCVERDTMDGTFLTESPLTILKLGNYSKVPVLYGFANMEGLLRIDIFEEWKEEMNKKFSDFLPADLKFESEKEKEEVGNKVKKFYFGDEPVGNNNILGYIDYFSDVMFTFPMLWAVTLYANNNKVYLYEYSFVDENDPLVPNTEGIRGAAHCAQSFAVLDGKDESKETPGRQKMRRTIREIWRNFAKTGNPIAEGSTLPTWPAARVDRIPYMVLDKELKLHEAALLGDRTEFWEDIYEKHYQDAVPPAPSGVGKSGTNSAVIALSLVLTIAISSIKFSFTFSNSF